MSKLNLKVIIIIIGLILFESVFYLVAKLTPLEPFLLSSSIDNKLPLISEFIYFYIFWYVMLFLVPYVIYCKNKDLFYKYVSIFVFCVIISSIVFFFFPTMIERPVIIVNDLDTFILNLIYLSDTPALNCFPSMHCAICFLFIYMCFSIKKTVWWHKLLIIISSILVILSTLFIKQHVIWDVIGALILCLIAIVIVKISSFDSIIQKVIKKYFEKDIYLKKKIL